MEACIEDYLSIFLNDYADFLSLIFIVLYIGTYIYTNSFLISVINNKDSTVPSITRTIILSALSFGLFLLYFEYVKHRELSYLTTGKTSIIFNTMNTIVSVIGLFIIPTTYYLIQLYETKASQKPTDYSSQ